MIQTLTGINSTASALSAERLRMDVITQNIANANTTRGVDGQPYQRQRVVFETLLNQAQGIGTGAQGVAVARIEKDQRPPRLLFCPNHPEANAEGFVTVPNINIHEEMADMIIASRAYEANLSVVKNSRTLAMKTFEIGK